MQTTRPSARRRDVPEAIAQFFGIFFEPICVARVFFVHVTASKVNVHLSMYTTYDVRKERLRR